MKENSEWISAYLAPDVDEETKKIVEEKARTDAAFAAALRQQQADLLRLRAVGRAQAKSTLKASLEEVSVSNSITQTSNSLKKIWMGAALAVAASLALLMWAPWQARLDTRTEALAMWTPYQMDIARGNDIHGSDSVRQQAQVLYQAQDFESAIPLMEQWQALEPFSGRPKLYLALCYMGAEKYSLATPLLMKLDDNILLQEPAKWYLALNYLMMEQNAQAVPYLNTLIQAGRYKAVEAQKLLEMMEAE